MVLVVVRKLVIEVDRLLHLLLHLEGDVATLSDRADIVISRLHLHDLNHRGGRELINRQGKDVFMKESVRCWTR